MWAISHAWIDLCVSFFKFKNLGSGGSITPCRSTPLLLNIISSMLGLSMMICQCLPWKWPSRVLLKVQSLYHKHVKNYNMVQAF